MFHSEKIKGKIKQVDAFKNVYGTMILSLIDHVLHSDRKEH